MRKQPEICGTERNMKNQNAYVRDVMRRIRCGGAKKKEIRKQLETDIAMRLEQGAALEEVLEEMGSAKEFAQGFNENLSAGEKRKYRMWQILKVVLAVLVVLVILVTLVSRMLPRTIAIEDSQYFEQAQVESRMKETIALLDEEDYETLKSESTADMATIFDGDGIRQVKSQMADDFGQPVSYSTAYIVDMVQSNTHYAVGEMTVAYENVSVTYRLTYDENMKLAGLYMR